jgi:tetratricopeptide (TPR) repeat protein
LFLLLSFILFLKSTQEREAGADTPKNALYILSILSFVVSILSKEIAIIFPLMLCLYLLTFRRPGAKGRPYIYLAPFAAIALLYAIARKTIIDFSGISQSFFMAEFPFYIRILTTFKAICVYLGLIIVPFNLHMEREIAVARPLAEPYSFLAALVVATLIIIVIWLNQRSRRLFFAGAWFFIALIPVSNIVPINSFIAEHWVYMPAIGVYMIAGVLIGRYFFDGDADKTAPPARRVAGAIIVAALFAFYSILTMARNRDWKDEITFFQNALKYSPNKARLHLNFGNTYHERDKKKEALQEYEKAIELKPQFAEPYNNIAGVYMELRRYDEAKNYAMKALAIKPQLHQSLNILGILSEMEGNIPKAEECYLKAINATPDYIDCRMSLAALYMNYGKREKAIQQWKEVLRIDPNHKEARQLINRFSK